MAKKLRLIKNSKRDPCPACATIHEFITRPDADAGCAAPVAYDYAVAEKVARLRANGKQDIVPVPDDTLVVMDDSARSLPVRRQPQLQHFGNRIRSM